MQKLANLSQLKAKIDQQTRITVSAKRNEKQVQREKHLDDKMRKQLLKEREQLAKEKVDLSHAFAVISVNDIQNSQCIMQGIQLTQNSQNLQDSPTQELFESQEDRTVTPLERLMSQSTVTEVTVFSKIEKVIM